MNDSTTPSSRARSVVRRKTSVKLTELAACCVVVVACWPQSASGLGVRIPNQDPAAIARGNAFAATADNPSALYYNPAGITQLQGHNVQVGSLFYLNSYADYQSPGGTRTHNDGEAIPVPELHYVYTPNNSLVSFGLGVYAPFGLSMKWPDNAPFASSGLEGKLTYLTVNPVIALKLHPTLSVAIGPTFNYSELKLRQAVGILPGDAFNFKGDDLGYGFTAGARWQPYDEWAVGLTYRSSVRENYQGTASLTPSPPFAGSFDSSSRLRFPQTVAGGVSFRPTPDWNFEVDVDWTDWHTVDQLAIQHTPTRPLNWISSFFYEFGVTRYLSKSYFLSAGYFYSEKSTPEREFIPTVPDTDLHVASLGGGFKGQNWRWAVAGQLIGGGWRSVNNNINPTVNGRYRLFTPSLSFSVGYHF